MPIDAGYDDEDLPADVEDAAGGAGSATSTARTARRTTSGRRVRGRRRDPLLLLRPGVPRGRERRRAAAAQGGLIRRAGRATSSALGGTSEDRRAEPHERRPSSIATRQSPLIPIDSSRTPSASRSARSVRKCGRGSSSGGGMPMTPTSSTAGSARSRRRAPAHAPGAARLRRLSAGVHLEEDACDGALRPKRRESSRGELLAIDRVYERDAAREASPCSSAARR